jgi:Glycerophosphoryl diester phosphodiesterase family
VKRLAVLFLAASAAAALSSCGASDAGSGATDPTATTPDGAAPDDGGTAGDAASPPDAAGPAEASAANDTGAPPPADAGLPDGASYRSSLRVCWNDPACPRALAISHGGDWALAGPPYDSSAALTAAYDHGADAVKIDVRYTLDNVGVISHSSPIQTYESVDCSGKKIEEMTAAQVTACHRFPSNETFQRLTDVLELLRGKLVAQLCVKVNTEFGKTIADVMAHKAEDFAFIEANSGDFPSILPLPDADKVYYVVNVGTTVADVDTVLGFKNPRIIMIEIDPSVALNGMAALKIHPGGARAFTYDNSSTATAATLKALFDQGYDVVSSNLTAPDVQARIQVNQARGLAPP